MTSYEISKFAESKNKTLESCLEAVSKDGACLKFVPEEFQTFDVYKKALEHDGQFIMYVINQTEELCLIAVQSNRTCSLQYVKNQTYAICLKAVETSGWSLKWVDQKILDYNLCLVAVKKNHNALQYVPAKYQTSEIIKITVLGNENYTQGRLLKFIAPELRTYDLCLKAVSGDGYAIEFVPEKFYTAEMLLSATTNNCNALSCIDKKFQTPMVCLNAIKSEEAYFVREKPDNPSLSTVPKIYESVKICSAPDSLTTISNLNKLLIKETIKTL